MKIRTNLWQNHLVVITSRFNANFHRGHVVFLRASLIGIVGVTWPKRRSRPDKSAHVENLRNILNQEHCEKIYND